LYIILGIISSLPVVLIKIFMSKNIITSFSIGLLIIELVILHGAADLGYVYFISQNISLAKFYPIIKCIELLIPIIFTVFAYGTKLNTINYIGILFALIAIVCIHWK